MQDKDVKISAMIAEIRVLNEKLIDKETYIHYLEHALDETIGKELTKEIDISKKPELIQMILDQFKWPEDLFVN